MKKTQPFSANQFTATQFSSAADKAAWANAMAAWILEGFEGSTFTKRLYDGLHLHMYGHIAHFNKWGFYGTWFQSNRSRLDWLEFTQKKERWFKSIDNPSLSWCDVEQAFSAWITKQHLVEKYEAIVAAETEQRERAQLATLKAKYEKE